MCCDTLQLETQLEAERGKVAFKIKRLFEGNRLLGASSSEKATCSMIIALTYPHLTYSSRPRQERLSTSRGIHGEVTPKARAGAGLGNVYLALRLSPWVDRGGNIRTAMEDTTGEAGGGAGQRSLERLSENKVNSREFLGFGNGVGS